MKPIYLTCLLCALLALAPAAAFAASPDEDEPAPAKYLEGAVPLDENGRLTYYVQYSAPGQTSLQLYEALEAYAKETIVGHDNALPQSRVTELDSLTGIIAVSVADSLIFTQRKWVTHGVQFYCQLVFTISNEAFTAEMRNLRVLYAETEQYGFERTPDRAEKYISDKQALTRDKSDLRKGANGKMRRAIIDRKDELFSGAALATGASIVEEEE